MRCEQIDERLSMLKLKKCLFLDEAYSLSEASDCYAKEALAVLLTEVENRRTSVLTIMAGYKDKMGVLMRADPGLPRRFPTTIHLADFDETQIAKIAIDKVTAEREIPIEDGLLEALADHVLEKHGHEMSELNAGLAANIAEAASGQRLQRIHEMPAGQRKSDINAEPLCRVDFGIGEETDDAVDEAKASVNEAVAKLIGMKEAKSMFATYVQKMRYVEMTGDFAVLQKCMNIVITGNPGTGKTSFARIMFRFLRAHGILKRDAFVEKNALELKGRYIGQTAPNVIAAVAAAEVG